MPEPIVFLNIPLVFAPDPLAGSTVRFTLPSAASAPPPAPPPAPEGPRGFLPWDKVLPALNEPSRWAIVRFLLEHGPRPVGVLARQVRKERSVVSKHVLVLREAGIVTEAPSPFGDGRHSTVAVPEQWRVPGEPLTLEFGSVRVRLGRTA